MPIARGIQTNVVVRNDGQTVVWAKMLDDRYLSQEDIDFFIKAKTSRPMRWVMVFVGTPEGATAFLTR